MRAHLHRHLLIFATAATGISGCASTVDDDGYPSLAKRAIEGQLVTVAPEPVAEPAPPPPATELTARLTQIETQANSGQSAFRSALGRASVAVASARGSAASTEAWVAAQMAVSALEADRAPSVLALASLDALRIARLDAGDRAGSTEIDDLHVQLEEMVVSQDAELDRLASGLRPA